MSRPSDQDGFTPDGSIPGGIGAVIMVLCLMIGGSFATHGPSDAERRQVKRCQPIVWHEGVTDPQSWELLRDQGYVGREDDDMEALYPPSCEGTNR